MAPMVWNMANNEKLLIYLLASNPTIKLNFEGAAKYLTNKEQQCTARAVQERFKKMKRTVGDDPKWATLAEQAAQGHGKAIRTINIQSSDDEEPLRVRKGKALHHKSAASDGGSARKRRKVGESGDAQVASRVSPEAGGESDTD